MFPESPQILNLDHLVMTVRDIDATCRFYRVLGFEVRSFLEGRLALHFGNQKINLHQADQSYEQTAAQATPGSFDLCFMVAGSLERVSQNLADAGLAPIEGPVRRTGANGPIDSIYLRDPDGNLIELSVPARDDL